ncbi:MAG: AbrB family transcriptional regulator [Pseudomonadota bacterium]
MHVIEQYKPVLLALLIGLTCGYGGFIIGMPLPWMLGPMIGNTVAALLQLPIRGPAKLRPIVIPIIGVMLGSAMTPALFADLGPWAATLLALPLVLAGTASASFLIYRHFGHYDTVTAYFAAMPGGLNEMLIQGEEAGGDAKKIALAHAVRILMVIFFVVAFFWVFLGVRTEGTTHWTTVQALTFRDYVILAVCAAAGVWVGHWLKLPAAPVFGPMLLSGATHLLGWVTLPPPSLLVIMAQLVMGTIIGCRFVGSTLQEIRGDLLLGLVASLSMLIAAVICAELLALGGLPLAQSFLAFAPGGLTEMSLLALSMDQDPAYVSTIHLIRITLVIAAAPLVFRLFQR